MWYKPQLTAAAPSPRQIQNYSHAFIQIPSFKNQITIFYHVHLINIPLFRFRQSPISCIYSLENQYFTIPVTSLIFTVVSLRLAMTSKLSTVLNKRDGSMHSIFSHNFNELVAFIRKSVFIYLSCRIIMGTVLVLPSSRRKQLTGSATNKTSTNTDNPQILIRLHGKKNISFY